MEENVKSRLDEIKSAFPHDEIQIQKADTFADISK